MLSESKLDILAITETHLDDETPTEEVTITGYQVARLDRKDQQGGGCIIYSAQNFFLATWWAGYFSPSKCSAGYFSPPHFSAGFFFLKKGHVFTYTKCTYIYSCFFENLVNESFFLF